MTHNWIIDVLSDLRTFAEKNGLEGLALQLDNAQLMAALEIAAKTEGLRSDALHKDYDLRTHAGAPRERQRASWLMFNPLLKNFAMYFPLIIWCIIG